MIRRLCMISCHVVRLSVLCVHIRRRLIVTSRRHCLQITKKTEYVSGDLSSLLSSFFSSTMCERQEKRIVFLSLSLSSFVELIWHHWYIYQPREKETESIQRCALFMRRNVKNQRRVSLSLNKICNEWWTNIYIYLHILPGSMSWNKDYATS